jgi:predicted tellurium resistance membrane protein TerC
MEEAAIGSILLSVLTLSALEIVLGIDNIIFISIIAEKLPANQRDKARKTGLILALFARVVLLCSISFIIGMKDDLFNIGNIGVSGRDLILISGGIFLIYKTGKEIWEKISDSNHEFSVNSSGKETYGSIIFQIVLIDIVFSFDSILTAVGLVDDIRIMVAAVFLSMGVMWFFSGAIADFVAKYPGIKMLALFFLVAIGVLLVVEGFEFHVEKSYVYFAMGFSLIVELLNIQARKAAAKKALAPEPKE